MSIDTNPSISTRELITGLTNPNAYKHPVDSEVRVHQTHISMVFLAGDFAYKVKKPIKTDFLDYSTLELRKHFCEQELRLDRRYAPDLYVAVVPICRSGGGCRVEADGQPIEYAVKMRRFPEGALLSERIETGLMTSSEVFRLAETIASFHQSAAVCQPDFASGWPDFLAQDIRQIFGQLESHADGDTEETLDILREWSEAYLREHQTSFTDRVKAGFIRECHGDLHLQNVVHWGGSLIPFDGIEFNERLRWIDVLSDAAFLAMDLAARGHLDLSRSFMNAYVQHAGDYASLETLRWYLFYRAMVRALVPTIRAAQSDTTDQQCTELRDDARRHIKLAYRFTLKEAPSLWITHGVSGSGKTILSETVVQRHDCFRLRSDVERKRMIGIGLTERVSDDAKDLLYGQAHTVATYGRLASLSRQVLRCGYSVIVDATFLKREQREQFAQLAVGEGVAFKILNCHADYQTLRQRVADRIANSTDASDADGIVLDQQLATIEPLTQTELKYTVEIPNPDDAYLIATTR